MPFDGQTLVIVFFVGVAAGWIGGIGDRGGAGGHVIAGVMGAALAVVLATIAEINLSIGEPLIARAVFAALGAGVGVLVSRFVLS
jgi:uncharacterized membrane protein YeaQ/YmgE (transglycosylase-associated protein family)